MSLYSCWNKYVVRVHNFVETLPTVFSIEHANMDERDLCALYLFHALCAVSTRCDKWVSQSVYERNTRKEFSRTNRNGNVEFSRHRRQHKPFQVCLVVLGVGADQPSVGSLQVTYRGCMATSLQQDLQGVSLRRTPAMWSVQQWRPWHEPWYGY